MLKYRRQLGLFLNCTKFRPFEVFERLKSDLEKSGISGNSATLSAAIHNLNVDNINLSLGELYETDLNEDW